MSFVHLHAPNARPAADDICLVLQGDRLLARQEGPSSVAFPEFATLAGWAGLSNPPLHAGRTDGRPQWLVTVDPSDVAPPAGWQWHDTRALLGLFAPDQWHALSCARQLSWWEGRSRFCGACGTPTVPAAEERARRCPKCGALFYPAAFPAVIVAVTRGDELLLAHNRRFRPGMFSLLAGFVDPGETLEQAVAREVGEEVGIRVSQITYLASQPWTFPNSLMMAFRARYAGGDIAADGREIEEARWCTRRALPPIPSHGTIARSIIDRWLGE